MGFVSARGAVRQGKMMSLGNISREALTGSVTLGAVFVAGYFLGKSESVQILLPMAASLRR